MKLYESSSVKNNNYRVTIMTFWTSVPGLYHSSSLETMGIIMATKYGT